jgi:CarD family transcriptional regulator
MDGSTELFEAGEKVMYPQFGLGTISGVTQKKVNGSDLSFYRLEFPLRNMEILVPVKRAAENGLRKVMGEEEVESILTYLKGAPPCEKPQQWHRWRKRTLEQLKTGDPLEIAKIYCYLNSLENKKGLSFTERKILLQVERMLVTEISAARQISEDQAGQLILAHPNGNGSANRNGNGAKA